MLPYTIYGNMNTPAEGASLETQITWMYTSIFLMLVGMIVYQILSIPLEMTYYILADKPTEGNRCSERKYRNDAGKLWKISDA